MIKLTVVYGHPTDTDAFENYYANIHLPLVDKMKGYDRSEFTIFMPPPDNSASPFYRMAEFWFDGPEALRKRWLHRKDRQQLPILPILLPAACRYWWGWCKANCAVFLA